MAPLMMENSGALLVSGAAFPEENMAQPLQMKKVKVMRAFYDHTRRVVKPGEVVDLPKIFALEMIAANKAAHIVEEAAPAAKEAEEPKKAPDKEARHAR